MERETLFEQACWPQKMRRWATLMAVACALGVGCETADPADEPDPVIVTGVPVGGGPDEETTPHDLANLETALERPALHVGNTVVGQATVYQVVSDRGFWLEVGEQRIFTLIRERDRSVTDVDLQRGHLLQLSGELHSTDDLDAVAGELSSQAEAVLSREEFFLVVSPNTIQIISRGVAVRSD